MASLSFQHVYKKYEGGVVAVSDFNLDVADKEFVILVGPSGCGKSTTLRMLAGLEDISEGEIYIDDRCVNDVLPKDRDIAMVFQNYALYPHMSVRDILTCQFVTTWHSHLSSERCLRTRSTAVFRKQLRSLRSSTS